LQEFAGGVVLSEGLIQRQLKTAYTKLVTKLRRTKALQYSEKGGEKSSPKGETPADPKDQVLPWGTRQFSSVSTAKSSSFFEKHPQAYFLIPFIVLLVLDAVVFLVVYPGIASKDSSDVMKIILGLPFESHSFRYDSLNNHHPVLYIFIVGAIMKTALAVGLSEAIAVALVTLFHSLCMAFACSYLTYKLATYTKSRLFFLCCLCFFALNPLVAIYSVTIWKDILFAVFYLCFVIEVAGVALTDRPQNVPKAAWVRLAVFALVSILLRNNGIIALVATGVVALIVSKHFRKQVLICFGSILLIYAAVTGPLFAVLGVAPGHFSESVGVMLQQVAYAVQQKGAIPEKAAAEFDSILPLNEWGDLYLETSANPVKFSDNFKDDALESDKGAFIEAWAATGLSNPRLYFQAWINQTSAFWSVKGKTWYLEKPGYSLDGGEKITSNKLEGLLSYKEVKSVFKKVKKAIPALFTIGWLVWGMLFVLFYNVCRRNYRFAFITLPLVFYWATYLVAAPANDFRYMFPLLLAVPLLAYLFMWKVGPHER
jgi:hypothetical protein